MISEDSGLAESRRRRTGRNAAPDVARLRQQFPGWTFGTVWATAASGPDRRRVSAVRDGIVLSAWTAEDLAADIGREPPPAQ